MTQKDHIKNILKDVFKNEPNTEESLNNYLERKAALILNYVPNSTKEIVTNKK